MIRCTSVWSKTNLVAFNNVVISKVAMQGICSILVLKIESEIHTPVHESGIWESSIQFNSNSFIQYFHIYIYIDKTHE